MVGSVGISALKWMQPASWAQSQAKALAESKIIKYFQDLGIELDQDQIQNLDLHTYLEDMLIGRPRARDNDHLTMIGHALKPIVESLIEKYPNWIKAYDPVLGSGKTLYGFFERLWLAVPVNGQGQQLSDEKSLYAEDERLFSALPDRELPIQSLVWMRRQPELWQVGWVQEHAGGWICAYIPVDEKYRGQAILACRGTALRLMASGKISSLANDLLPQLGAKAVQESWPYLGCWLKQNGIYRVEIGGKSLGGCMAQLLTPLLVSNHIYVHRLVTLQSPGVCLDVHQEMVRWMSSSTQQLPMLIRDYRY